MLDSDTLKLPETEIKVGSVKRLGQDQSYAFIVADDGSGETFAHLNHFKKSNILQIVNKQKVSYSIKQAEDGRIHAYNIQIINS